MTKVSYVNKRGLHRIRAKGHATGSPEVCAGISAILYSLGGWLANDQGNDTLIRLDSGDALLYCGTKRVEVTTAFDVAIVGIMQIAKKYPESLCIMPE